ncbi:Uncharacterized lipoprotein YddW, UPF0748 family [Roseateles sp. YR242]|uniref:glycoside hydrolase family 10 protein n=1 Tax=Roseateles sp. YR242 TaxID=1855305 RepID=UPI0008CA5EFE|nr:family 10 glycosylhydrolase [Roseateles sp. YR242]SEK80962.1 Uncharacterized lipoprotein YddW, UPF0748 family [Roseateles sp. YR242]
MQRRRLLHAALGWPAATLGAGALNGCASVAHPSLPDTPPATSPVNGPPPVPREFRGVWVASVANIDWPSRRGLTAEQQVAEIHQLLDTVRDLRLNAVVLQVRTSADALYASTLEPWSEYLTGVQGQPPGYDPLAVWLAEAHARGLELHGWINPYRARQSGAKSALSPQHVSRSRPAWVKTYGDQLWIDPGEPEAADHTLAVCKDLLSRYAVDGLHIDDYFYPYPVQDSSKQELDFPDELSWQRYLNQGGTLSRTDWRRDNVDRLVERLHTLVREVRPTARLGISPFGLPRPDQRPAGIEGFSQYDRLYADVERWLAQGWLDYLAPQLYWPRAQKPQAFETLLRSWQGLNPQQRHIWPGLFTSKAVTDVPGWTPEEIPAQVEICRTAPATSGHLHFSMVALAQNRRGLTQLLRQGVYTQPALPPTTPWLTAPPCGEVKLLRQADGSLRLATQDGAPARLFALWRRVAHRPEAAWRFELIPADGRLPAPESGETLVACAINDINVEGPAATFVA